MASDLDTVRVLRALFNDMPRAPQGLSQEETMAWVQQSMTEYEGGDMAYMIEHITRNSMLDIVLRLREDGYLKDDTSFAETLDLLATPAGRKSFMDRCIQAQKSADATSRLINRAKREWTDPLPLFSSDPGMVARFVRGELSGPGPLYAEFKARDDVREIGVFEQAPDGIHEFSWGFVVEDDGAWLFYIADVWRRGTVGSFERFHSAWRQATTTGAVATAVGGGGDEGHQPEFSRLVPPGLQMDDGISTFSGIALQTTRPMCDSEIRRWIGEVFIDHMLPTMAARVVDPQYDFPLVSVQTH